MRRHALVVEPVVAELVEASKLPAADVFEPASSLQHLKIYTITG